MGMLDLQKASMWKRISAFLFDGILLGVVVVLIAWLLSFATGFDGYLSSVNDAYERYAQEYQVNFTPTLSEYEALTEEELETLNAAYAAFSADEDAAYAFDMLVRLSFLTVSLSIFLGYLAMEFIVPLLLGNGQTLGKKIFGIGLMRKDGIKVNGVCLFIRAILGKYTIETMIPVLLAAMIFLGVIGLTGLIVMVLILLLQIILIIATPTNALIHDQLASTVVIDVGSQMIFNTREELIAYKQKLHEEKVARQPY